MFALYPLRKRFSSTKMLVTRTISVNCPLVQADKKILRYKDHGYRESRITRGQGLAGGLRCRPHQHSGFMSTSNGRLLSGTGRSSGNLLYFLLNVLGPSRCNWLNFRLKQAFDFSQQTGTMGQDDTLFSTG